MLLPTFFLTQGRSIWLRWSTRTVFLKLTIDHTLWFTLTDSLWHCIFYLDIGILPISHVDLFYSNIAMLFIGFIDKFETQFNSLWTKHGLILKIRRCNGHWPFYFNPFSPTINTHFCMLMDQYHPYQILLHFISISFYNKLMSCICIVYWLNSGKVNLALVRVHGIKRGRK